MAEGIQKHTKKEYANSQTTYAKAPEKSRVKPVDTKHATDVGMTPRQKDAVLKTEAADRGYKSEKMTVIDNNGNILYEKRGGKNSASIPNSELYKLNDAVITHNHPQRTRATQGMASEIGVSLSGADASLMTLGNAKEVRAQTDGYVFSLRRGKNDFGSMSASERKRLSEKISDDWNIAFNRYTNEHTNLRYTEKAKDDRVGIGKYRSVKDELHLDRLNAVAAHYATREIANRYGFEYTRRKQKGTGAKRSY